jgi:hypothetical protein
VHGGLFFGWATSRGLIASWVERSTPDAFAKFREGEITGPKLFAAWDGALLDDLFTDEGLAFVVAYYRDPQGFAADWSGTMAAGLASEFHVADDAASAARAAELFDRRFAAWRAVAGAELARPDLRSTPNRPADVLPPTLTVPVLPVTRGIVLPGGHVGMRAARAASVAAVRAAEAADGRIALFCLLDPAAGADPTAEDLLDVGVLATLDRVSDADRPGAVDVVAACRVRVEIAKWVDRTTWTAEVAVRADPEPTPEAGASIGQARELVAGLIRVRSGEPPGTLALGASLSGGALLDHVAREADLTDDERMLTLGALDLEARASIVITALGRLLKA